MVKEKRESSSQEEEESSSGSKEEVEDVQVEEYVEQPKRIIPKLGSVIQKQTTPAKIIDLTFDEKHQ